VFDFAQHERKGMEWADLGGEALDEELARAAPLALPSAVAARKEEGRGRENRRMFFPQTPTSNRPTQHSKAKQEHKAQFGPKREKGLG